MMRKFSIFLGIFIIFCFPVLSKENNAINFSLEFSKTGVTSFYFCEPGRPNVRMNSIVFPILSDVATAVKTSVGVHWNLFPEGSNVTENIRLVLGASSSGTFSSNESLRGFMLVNRQNPERRENHRSCR